MPSWPQPRAPQNYEGDPATSKESREGDESDAGRKWSYQSETSGDQEEERQSPPDGPLTRIELPRARKQEPNDEQADSREASKVDEPREEDQAIRHCHVSTSHRPYAIALGVSFDPDVWSQPAITLADISAAKAGWSRCPRSTGRQERAIGMVKAMCLRRAFRRSGCSATNPR